MTETFRPFSQQIAGILGVVQNRPYSDFVSNLILGLFALVIIILGILSVWISSHPRQFQQLWIAARKWSLFRFVEKSLTKGIQFLLNRFSTKGAYGISFTLGLLVVGVGIWIFGGLLKDVIAETETALLDAPLLSFIVSHRQPWLTNIMILITTLGGPLFIIPAVVLLGVAFRYWYKNWQATWILALATASAGLFDLLLKELIDRPRPLLIWRLIEVPGSAFPSGHAALAVFYIITAYLITRKLAIWQYKVLVWILGGGMMIAIGVSRVYLGVHWPTDVVGGWILALVWATLFIVTASTIDRLSSEKQTSEKEKEQSLRQELLTVALPELVPLKKGTLNGLSEENVQARIKANQVNKFRTRTSRTFWQIASAHIFTRFNALLGALLVITISVGEYRDALFGIIIILNSAIGIVQELRAKWTLDHLVFLTMTHVDVKRDGEVVSIPVSDIVVDDSVHLQVGHQIPVDGIVLKASDVEVDESQLTGESDPVRKEVGDRVYSGSFIVAGTLVVQAVKVGEEAYANKLAKVAQKFTLAHSELREGINTILRVITWLLVFIVPLLFLSQLSYGHGGWREAVIGAIAGVVGMIPEGLVLLTSVVMATAVMRLARQSALIQELAAVEVLARVDVLCVDKTGTLTDGRMTLEKLILAKEAKALFNLEQAQAVLYAFTQASSNRNASLQAISNGCEGGEQLRWKVESTIAFSSARKWSSVTFVEQGTWVLGAPDMIITQKNPSSVQAKVAEGKRVLVLAYAERKTETKTKVLPQSKSQSESQSESHIPLPPLTPVLYIVLNEELRPNVKLTLAYFREQGVTLKVISGDHAQTVAAIAKSVGISEKLESVDATTLPQTLNEVAKIAEKNTVFGRVTPSQKQLLIQGLQAKGHTVAMIGDGVNDVLALKTANFGISMGAGSDATRAIAKLILVNNDFGVLPDVIAEGRRVIANMERTANLFITKTAYAFLLALAVQVARVPFPFLPRHLTIISFFTIGVPALLLSFAKNNVRAKTGFVSRVLRFSLPMGALLAGLSLVTYALIRHSFAFDMGFARTGATITLVMCGFAVLFVLQPKATFWHRLLSSLLVVLFGIMLFIPQFQQFFALRMLSPRGWGIVGICSLIGIIVINILGNKLLKKRQKA